MKHISCIDNVENLRALIRSELRDLGIKVPKHKKNKRGADKNQQDVNKSQIFGNYLAHVHCVHVAQCGYVAKFLVDAAKIIRESIENEGIFRKSGAVSRQKEIKQQLEKGKGFVGANVHDVTALVKQFFRELPEPLFTSAYHDTFVRCFQLENRDEATKAILMLVHLLPGEHISTLRYIMILLNNIAQNSEQNKMDCTNLAVVLAPNIMHVNSKSVTMKSCEEKLLQVQTSVVELLINHAENVGMVDDILAEKTAFMSEVFSTDDELDASEDNLEDTKETRKKEKKRKRSGSFQGFVTSIAQSITKKKWRRSMDGGKTNTSGLSHGSNTSGMSTSGQVRATKGVENHEPTQQPVFQFSASDATPIVRRNKKPGTNTETKAFSASKKKAILNQLPNQVTLASTPFTPASTLKKMDINSVRRAQLDTPSMPPRPYQCTPRHSMKTPRKKLNLFSSPASTTKKKRYSSSSNLSVPSKKAVGSAQQHKSKGIFRRLSGSKGDQAISAESQKNNSNSLQIGQRLASPTKTTITYRQDTSSTTNHSQTIRNASPISAIAKNSSYSASVCEQSVISHSEDETRSLNDGFIMTGDDREVDISRIMSEPVISGAFDDGEYVMLPSMAPKESVSDTTILYQSNYETPKSGHSRSYSFDSILDNSTKCSSLKRGRPNSIKAGLLQGDHKEVHKLRRSFGLEKSDIGFPIPVSVADVSDAGHYVGLDCSMEGILGNTYEQSNHDDLNMNVSNTDVEMSESHNHDNDSPGSVSRCKPTDSTTSIDNKNIEDSAAGYECDDESETGFSTISGGTAVFVPKLSRMSLCKETINVDDEPGRMADVEPTKLRTLAQQKQESKDSLLSQASTSSLSPQLVNIMNREREMTRSISADSGKGSMCEEPMDDLSNATLDSITSSVLDHKEVQTQISTTEEVPASEARAQTKTNVVQLEDGPVINKPNLQQKKSLSSQDLTRDSETPTRVSRSKSLLDSSMGQRKTNIKPNLQISAETHKLLARAGYIKEQKEEEAKEEFDDFVIPTDVKFPLMIQKTETMNPRRESLIAIQKNNAGRVKSNVRQFDRFAETKIGPASKHESPFRFPNSTSRKRGMSPLRVPMAFVKGEKGSESIRQAMNSSKEKISLGTANVPISTQLIKPSDSFSETMDTTVEKVVSVKRKPSIYYTDKEVVRPSITQYRNASLDITMEDDLDSVPAVKNITNTNTQNDSVFHYETPTKVAGSFDGHNFDLDQSLQDTINSVCTPHSEKITLNIDRIGKGNKENTVGKTAPGIKPCMITTPAKIDAGTLRTASNKTPVEILKTSKSPRSPVKPLKRLGSSPHSPRCRTVRSPKMIKSNQRSLLSTIPDQFDELNNL